MFGSSRGNLINSIYEKLVSVLQFVDHGKGASYCKRGKAYQELDQHVRAISQFNLAVEIDPRYTSAFVLRGISYLRLEKFEQAIADFGMALSLEPNEEVSYFQRGLAYMRLDQKDLAIEDFSEALRINPSYTSARANRAVTFLKLGKARVSSLDFTKAIADRPDDPALYYGRGLAWMELGNLKDALPDFDQCISFGEEHTAVALCYRARVLTRTGDWEAAMEDLEQSAALGYDKMALYQFRGELYRLTGAYEQAEADLQQALALASDESDVQTYAFLALLYAGKGRSEEFFEALIAALDRGYRVWEAAFLHDPALDAYRGTQEFRELMKRYRDGKS